MTKIEIQNSTIKDVEVILELYKEAIKFQKEKSAVPWQALDRELIELEVKEKRQWKLVINDIIVCVWMTVFSDPEIWKEKNVDKALYIHRITTNITFNRCAFIR